MEDGENKVPEEEDLYSVAMAGRVEDIPRMLREHGGLRSSSLRLESRTTCLAGVNKQPLSALASNLSGAGSCPAHGAGPPPPRPSERCPARDAAESGRWWRAVRERPAASAPGWAPGR